MRHFRANHVQQVSENSDDTEIIVAINTAGEPRYGWWRDDWPKNDEVKSWVKSWVKPGDIGKSTREKGGDALVKRLRKMVAAGILEEKHLSPPPRFRVKH